MPARESRRHLAVRRSDLQRLSIAMPCDSADQQTAIAPSLYVLILHRDGP